MDAANRRASETSFSRLHVFVFLEGLYSFRKPTFPTFTIQAIDLSRPSLVGWPRKPDIQPDKIALKTRHWNTPQLDC